MKRITFSTSLFIAFAILSGCQRQQGVTPAAEPVKMPPSVVDAKPNTDAPVATTSINTPSKLDQWQGKWTGPEGTFLELSKSDNNYRIKIQTLDGATNYVGVDAGDQIKFQRNGKTESIRATSGKETGMKWLQDKTHCLTIAQGEGFCRD